MTIPMVLKVYDGGKLKVARAFRSESVRIGSSQVDLQLEARGVSPHHAVIETGAQGVILRALGTAPVYLNGQPILAAPVRHGDLITVGEVRILVELRPQQAQQPDTRKRARAHLQVIPGEEHPEPAHGPHSTPSLSVVRGAPAEVTGSSLSLPAGAMHVDSVPFDDVTSVGAPLPPPSIEMAALSAGPSASTSVAAASVAATVDVEPSPNLVFDNTPAPAPDAVTLAADVRGTDGPCVQVELLWGATRISVWNLVPGEELVAGTAEGCHAYVPGLERAVVVSSDEQGNWRVGAPRGLEMSLVEQGRAIGGPELLVRGRSQTDANGLQVPLPANAIAILGSGSVALRVRRVPLADKAGNERQDWRSLLVASIAAFALVGGMKLLSVTVPPPAAPLPTEVIRPRPTLVRASNKPDPVKVQERGDKSQGRKDPGQAVARHQGQEGQAGSKTAPRRDARAERKTDDRAVVAQTGLLKALGAGKGSSDVFGVALEKGTRDAMGHLTGPKVGDARGDGGMGLKSLGGTGGGGDGTGLGLARIGTNGIGGGLANYGDGKGGLRGKSDADIGLAPGTPRVVGHIDPELIRKVIHDHRAQIRHCYETRLNANPDLAGKMVAAWTIDQGGVVTETKTQESTMKDRTLESCVLSKVKTWRFPIPKGGGEVYVTYPFIFTPGG